MINYNGVLKKLGITRHQVLTLMYLTYITIPMGYVTYATVFISYTPDYRFGKSKYKW